MELIAPLPTDEISGKSYELFHVVMQTPVSLVYSQEKKWAASRLAIHGAYKWDKSLPWVDDPQHILLFLDHHFDLATRGDKNQDESIQYALRALAYASSPVTIEALEHFDPTKPSFIRGICYIYEDERPPQLREAALFLFSLIGDRWFNTDYPMMGPVEMRSLCDNWASAVNIVKNPHAFQKANLTVLLGMINSPHWRPHIFEKEWRLLKHFSLVPDDFPPLKRCIDNLELMEEIKRTGNPIAMTLWPTILWLKYKELMPGVREQLETITKEAAWDGGTDLDMYLSAIDAELRRAEDASSQYVPWPTDPQAIALRRKIANLQQAKDSLTAIKRGWKLPRDSNTQTGDQDE